MLSPLFRTLIGKRELTPELLYTVLDQTLAKIQPRMLILDPLVRLHRGDENSASEISELLEAFFATAETRMLVLYLIFSIPNALAWGAVLLAVLRELTQERRERFSASQEAF